MKYFVDSRYPLFYREHPNSVTEPQIIDGVLKDKLFGFIEVSIRVPDNWEQVELKPDTNLSPYEYIVFRRNVSALLYKRS